MTTPQTGRDEDLAHMEADAHVEADVLADTEESPEHLPPKAWVTLIMFAGFVIAFGTCASVFLFD